MWVVSGGDERDARSWRVANECSKVSVCGERLRVFRYGRCVFGLMLYMPVCVCVRVRATFFHTAPPAGGSGLLNPSKVCSTKLVDTPWVGQWDKLQAALGGRKGVVEKTQLSALKVCSASVSLEMVECRLPGRYLHRHSFPLLSTFFACFLLFSMFIIISIKMC